MAVWATTNKTLLMKVKKLQNFAAKVAVEGGVDQIMHHPF